MSYTVFGVTLVVSMVLLLDVLRTPAEDIPSMLKDWVKFIGFMLMFPLNMFRFIRSFMHGFIEAMRNQYDRRDDNE